MQEELGDLLLQVYFHSRVAEEDAKQPFDIEDVAKSVADKLIRRHPHVFAGEVVNSSADVLANWERQKAAEKGRTSAIDGVPLSQPALPLATKVLYRVRKLNYDLSVSEPIKLQDDVDQGQFGQILLGLITQAVNKGLDPEAALRKATKELIIQIQEHETR
jgi:XTP/dITP diphosphohydrolase